MLIAPTRMPSMIAQRHGPLAQLAALAHGAGGRPPMSVVLIREVSDRPAMVLAFFLWTRLGRKDSIGGAEPVDFLREGFI
jgi:hypothetical protein